MQESLIKVEKQEDDDIQDDIQDIKIEMGNEDVVAHDFEDEDADEDEDGDDDDNDPNYSDPQENENEEGEGHNFDDFDDFDIKMEEAPTATKDDVQVLKNGNLRINGLIYTKTKDEGLAVLNEDQFKKIIHQLSELDLPKCRQILNSKGDKIKVYPCPYCDNLPYIASQRLRHIALNHRNINRYYCLECHIGDKTKVKMLRHYGSAHGKKRLGCKQCYKTFAVALDLKKHEIIHRRDLDSKKTVKRPAKFRGMPLPPMYDGSKPPVLVENGHKFYAMDEPNSDIAQMSEEDYTNVMKSIYEVYHPENCIQCKDDSGKEYKMFKCDICGNQYKKNEVRVVHMFMVHKKFRRFRCVRCEFGGIQWMHVRNHIEMVHHNVRKFQCDICGLNLATKKSRQVHINSVHLKQREFMCPTCGKLYVSRGQLKHHMGSVHLKLKNKICTTCGQDFFDNSQLMRHIERHHKKTKVECEICGKVLAKSSYAAHKTDVHGNHPPVILKCKICHKELSKRSLNKHMKGVHGDAIHACSKCGKGFTLKHTRKLHESKCTAG